jgi:hypothetical protein
MSTSTPTDYPSSEVSELFVDRSAAKLAFPPQRPATAITDTITEIAERPNPKRRHRTYPRVVKRKTVGSKIIKRRDHRGTNHREPSTTRLLPRPETLN